MYLMRGQHCVGVAGVQVIGTLCDVETKKNLKHKNEETEV